MIFKKINFVPCLEISESGIVRKISNKRIKSQYVSSTGYYMISLSQNNKSKPYRVHRLLAETFIDNPQNKPEVNHLDGNKLNNELKNLEWVTHKENMAHAFRTGLANNTGAKNGRSKLTAEAVKKIKTLVQSMSQQKVANQFGVSRSCIQGIVEGRLWKHI